MCMLENISFNKRWPLLCSSLQLWSLSETSRDARGDDAVLERVFVGLLARGGVTQSRSQGKSVHTSTNYVHFPTAAPSSDLTS